MFETRVTELLRTRYPIIGGCMMHISTPAFVAAISDSGALGMMASAMYASQDDFRRAVQEVKALTDKPFGVNLSLFPALRSIDNDLYVDVILEENVPVVETSGHRPVIDLLARLHEGGVATMHKCVSVRHALSAESAGVDLVTVFGSEGGGHIGEFGLGTMVLVPSAVDALEVPVLAAGGIVDGRGFLAALALGAEGVTLGTRLLMTVECPIHENLKLALAAASELDTMPILRSLHNSLRAWNNTAARRVVDLEANQGDLREILSIVAGSASRRMFEEGDVEAGVIACSQGVGIVDKIEPVNDVIQGIVRTAESIAEHL